MDEDKYDDLGVRNGNQFDDYGGHARQAVKLWVPTAVGQRPIDWAKRDLVYGRSRNDGRNWQQRSLLKNKPPFLFAGVQHNTRDRDVIANLRTIQYLLYLKLYRLIDEQVHFSLKEKVNRMLSCPPSLFQTRNSNSLPMRNCDLAHLCPFCMSRSAANVFEHLDKTVFETERPSPLILLKLTRDIPLGSRRELIKQEKTKVSTWARLIAKESFGGGGGLLTFQVAPTAERKAKCERGEVVGSGNQEGLRLHFSVLTDMSRGFISDNQRQIEELTILDSLDIAERFDEYQVRCVLSAASPPGSGACGIRQLVFGRPEYQFSQSAEQSTSGAFSNHQLHLASANQWGEIDSLTRNMKLYNYFGSWKYPKGSSRAQPKFVNANAKTGKEKQVQALARENIKRSQDARVLAHQNIALVRPIFESLAQELGRQPGRKPFIDACGNAGIKLPKRRLYRCLKILKESSNA